MGGTVIGHATKRNPRFLPENSRLFLEGAGMNIGLSQFPGGDDMERFRLAAEYLRGNPGTTLQLEPKTYVLRDEKAMQLQRDVMAGALTKNPEPLMFNYDFDYVSGIDLNGARDVCIDGRGATLLFDGFMENISLQRCKNVTLKNINIDLARKAYSKGAVTGYGRNHTDADFGGQSMLCETMPTLRINVYCKKGRRFAAVESARRVQSLGGGAYRFFGMRHEGIGDEIYLTHTYHFRPSILIYEAENTTLENIRIHSHCGMGVVGHRAKDILLKGLRVVPSPGEAMSTNTDATHFTSCAGLLRFEDCQFEGQGDDATNVHTYYHSIVKASGNTCTAAVKAPTGTHCQKLDYFNPGDALELARIQDLAPAGTYRVLESRPDPGNMRCEYVLDGALPKAFGEYYLADVTQLPRLEFIGCTARNHLARSVLVKTRDVLIEDCAFDGCTGSAIHVAAEAHWHEGVTAENVVIRGNRITGCGRQGHGRVHDAGGVSINVLASKPGRAMHKNITIENNIIDCPDCKYAIYAGNVDGLTLRANRLRSGKQTVLIENCVNAKEVSP